MSQISSDMSDHIAQARQRARLVLGGEGHTLRADDLRYAALTARNALILVVLIWAVGRAFALPLDAPVWGRLLVAAGVGISIFLGIASGLRTHAEVSLFEAELERERREIETHPQEEREEVRALYAAKGLREPLLSQVVDVLCADEDRLLKIMMEEELGLFIQPSHHPILIGLANAVTAMIATLAVASPAVFLTRAATDRWVPLSAAALVAILAGLMSRFTGQPAVPLIARWLGLGAVSAGILHFLAQWLAGA